MKDGFDENVRMEMHAEAEESTYSVESEAEIEIEKTAEDDLPDLPEDQPGPSRASNKTIEIQGFSPLNPRAVSTPDVDQALFMEQTKSDILENLSKVQDLCNDTMKEVQSLKNKWTEAEVETNTLKVNFF